MRYNEANIDDLRRALRYEPDTGFLYWNHRDDVPSSVNAIYADTRAFTAKLANGYHAGKFRQKMFKAHRVIWAIVYGEWPANEVDHINGNRADNKLSNLRSASRPQNAKNRGPNRNNTSGFKGVSFITRDNTWAARIRVDKKLIHLGYFLNAEDAGAAYKLASAKYFSEFLRDAA